MEKRDNSIIGRIGLWVGAAMLTLFVVDSAVSFNTQAGASERSDASYSLAGDALLAPSDLSGLDNLTNVLATAFGPAINYSAGINPHSVAVGDFNHSQDSFPDLAVANYSSSNVSILKGNGNGTFHQPSASRNVRTRPFSVAVGDFNGNGFLDDLAVANYGSNNVSILLGNGNGTFQARRDYTLLPAGRGSRSVVVEDFNGDGKKDLVTANYLSSNVSVLLGTGTGTFVTPAPTYAVGTRPFSVAVGNFNGDTHPDLVTANYNAHSVSVLLGTSTGTFPAHLDTVLPPGNAPYSVAVKDFNGDGSDDLAAANYGSNNVSILKGNGGGTFQPLPNSPYQVGMNPYSVAVGDFDNDPNHYLDLAVANSGSNNVSILLGNGDGTFTSDPNPNNPYQVGKSPFSVAVGKFGYPQGNCPDLAVANYTSHNVSILLNSNFSCP